jgi:triphosphatase
VAIPVKHHNNELELAIDRGEIRAGRRSEPISEIEIEVKDGTPVEVVRLARRIATETQAGPKTKAGRGYALRAGEEHLPAFGNEIILRPP